MPRARLRARPRPEHLPASRWASFSICANVSSISTSEVREFDTGYSRVGYWLFEHRTSNNQYRTSKKNLPPGLGREGESRGTTQIDARQGAHLRRPSSASPVTRGGRLRLLAGAGAPAFPGAARGELRLGGVGRGFQPDVRASLATCRQPTFPGQCRWKGSPVGRNYRQNGRDVKVKKRSPGRGAFGERFSTPASEVERVSPSPGCR